MDKPGRGAWRVQAGSNPKGGWQLSRADLAQFIVNQLESDQWVRGYPTIAW